VSCVYELLLYIVRKRDTTTPLRGGSDRSSPSVLQKRKKNRTQNVKTGVNVCIFIPVTLLLTAKIPKTHCAPIQTDLSARRRRRSCSKSRSAYQHPSRIYLNISHVLLYIYTSYKLGFRTHYDLLTSTDLFVVKPLELEVFNL